jgi:hypothetical protein
LIAAPRWSSAFPSEAIIVIFLFVISAFGKRVENRFANHIREK